MLEWKIKEFHCLERAKGKVNLQWMHGCLCIYECGNAFKGFAGLRTQKLRIER